MSFFALVIMTMAAGSQLSLKCQYKLFLVSNKGTSIPNEVFVCAKRQAEEK